MMKFQYWILFVCVFSLLAACDQNNEEAEKTSFQFKITNALNGEITSKEGTLRLESQGDRTVLFFEETIDDRADSSDLLIGEIILGFQTGDTTGVYPLNEISGKREKGKVGIVTFLERLEFDELTNQYISNLTRYERVQRGSVEITEWSTEINGILKGKLNVTLGEKGDKVKIKGEFTGKWNDENMGYK